MNIEDMLALLKNKYKEKDRLEKYFKKLVYEYDKNEEDIEMIETFIMYKSNRSRR